MSIAGEKALVLCLYASLRSHEGKKHYLFQRERAFAHRAAAYDGQSS